MQGIIYVRLRDSGQVYSYDSGNLEVKEGNFVIVEHDRGLDYGQVVLPNKANAPDKGPKEALKKILRLASEKDLKQIEDNRLKAKEAFGMREEDRRA